MNGFWKDLPYFSEYFYFSEEQLKIIEALQCSLEEDEELAIKAISKMHLHQLQPRETEVDHRSGKLIWIQDRRHPVQKKNMSMVARGSSWRILMSLDHLLLVSSPADGHHHFHIHSNEMKVSLFHPSGSQELPQKVRKPTSSKPVQQEVQQEKEERNPKKRTSSRNKGAVVGPAGHPI
ncbi:hypothetical protein B9Z55_024086 [Caenorhabditis nigoni]|uniref:Uncharacterized protein n=1 Tax=Caenorhabditis nigoni TaxID=1611254 RepID=A0A2G5SSP0_9PELO|nr:hypothetical protein B9Z55_024086 [Caenorhabditis nigoni]